MPTQAISTQLDVKITIGGTEIVKTDINDVLVESELDQPDMVAISLSNQTRYSEKIKEGDPIEVKLGAFEGNQIATVFKGEVTGLEPVYQVSAPLRVVVRGLNALHTLARGKKSVSYLNVTDKDIVERVARAYGLTPEFGGGAPSTKYEHVYQHNQTDLEFLRLRAARIGYSLLVEDKKLFFSKRPEQESDIKLQFGVEGHTTIERFSPRLSTANQVSEVRVRGWDPEKKKEILGVAKPQGSKLGDKTGSEIADATHAGVLAIDVDVPVFTKEEADAIAKSLLEDRLMSFITGDASSVGNPAMKPGIIVTIELADKRFAGKYYITSVRHRYVHKGSAGGYRTEFKFRRDARAEAE